MTNSFSFEAISELFSLNVTVFGKVGIVAAFGGEKPVGVNKVDAVSVSCDPDCLRHELVLV
jgi:hypothetical protein